MTTPVTHTATTAMQSSINANTNPVAPIGLGSQPTTISSSSNSSDKDYWQNVKSGLDSFGDFIRNLVVKALDTIHSSIGFVADWIAGRPMEIPSTETTHQSPWQLPQETPLQTPHVVSSQDPFATLTLTDPERQKIYTIIHTIGISQGMTGWMTLLRQKSTLEQLGQEINHVHPLKFIEYPLKHRTLTKDLDSLSQSPLTWRPFVEGFSEKMRRENATLAGYKLGFARSLNVNLTDIDPFFASSNWEALLKFLIDVKNGRKNSVWIEPSPSPESTTSAAPPLSAETTTIAVTTTAATAMDPSTSTPILITPSPVVLLANLPFERGDEEIMADLMNRYTQKSRLWLLWNHGWLQLQWTHLGVRHPLKLLAYIYSNPALMTQMDAVFGYYGTKSMFTSALTGQLSRIPFAEVRPYIDEFAQVCQLDPNQTRQFIQNGQWYQLVEQLHRSYFAQTV
jgi:hypothetical protein